MGRKIDKQRERRAKRFLHNSMFYLTVHNFISGNRLLQIPQHRADYELTNVRRPTIVYHTNDNGRISSANLSATNCKVGAVFNSGFVDDCLVSFQDSRSSQQLIHPLPANLLLHQLGFCQSVPLYALVLAGCLILLTFILDLDLVDTLCSMSR